METIIIQSTNKYKEYFQVIACIRINGQRVYFESHLLKTEDGLPKNLKEMLYLLKTRNENFTFDVPFEDVITAPMVTFECLVHYEVPVVA